MSPCLNTQAYVQLPGSWGGIAETSIEAWVYVVLPPDPAGPTGPVGDIVSTAVSGEFVHTHIYNPVTPNPNPLTDPSDAAYISGGTATSLGIDVADVYPLGTWRHIVAVFKSGASALFENGVQQDGPTTTTYTTINATSNLTIARGLSGGRYFTGRLAKVAIYSQALTSTRISAHYAAASAAAYDSAVATDTPLGYWKLDEASGTTAADSSGNGRNGTYNGVPRLHQPGPYGSDFAALFVDQCLRGWVQGNDRW